MTDVSEVEAENVTIDATAGVVKKGDEVRPLTPEEIRNLPLTGDPEEDAKRKVASSPITADVVDRMKIEQTRAFAEGREPDYSNPENLSSPEHWVAAKNDDAEDEHRGPGQVHPDNYSENYTPQGVALQNKGAEVVENEETPASTSKSKK